ncbi:MAG: hypothetical protein WB392_12040 [Methanotrichaceae archaeon]
MHGSVVAEAIYVFSLFQIPSHFLQIVLSLWTLIVAYILQGQSSSGIGVIFFSLCILTITAHARAHGVGKVTGIVGPSEPLVGREWKDHAGQDVSYKGVYFVPGCEAKGEHEFVIDPYGRWKAPGK